jgi:hypothetical protein
MQRLLSRAAVAAALAAVALILVTLALVFLGAALVFWLRAQFVSPAGSAAIVGIIGLLLAAVLVLIARMMFGRRSAAAPTAATTTDAAAILGQAMVGEALSLARAHPYRTLLVSVAVGFIAGAIPEVRRFPFDLFKKKE